MPNSGFLGNGGFQPGVKSPANPTGATIPPNYEDPGAAFRDKSFLANNPFVPGTREYNDWVKSAVDSQKELAGKPQMPEFTSALDASGRIKDVYRMNPGSINVGGDVAYNNVLPGVEKRFDGLSADPRALEAIRGRALGSGPSPWLNLQLQKQGMEEQNALEDAHKGAAGAQSEMESALAMRGGLSSGARERLATSGLESGLLAGQGVRRAGEANRLGLNIADDATKTDLLKSLPGMELNQIAPEIAKAEYLGGVEQNQNTANLANTWQNRTTNIEGQKYNTDQATAANKFNIQAALNDLLQKRAYDLGKYGEEMKGFAAEKTGEAVGSGGKK